MFGKNVGVKLIITLVLQIIAAGYIGFFGFYLLFSRPEDSSTWFLVLAVFFIVFAVGFVVFSIIMFVRNRRILKLSQEETGEIRDTSTGETSAVTETEGKTTSAGNPRENGRSSLNIREMARYRSEDLSEEDD